MWNKSSSQKIRIIWYGSQVQLVRKFFNIIEVFDVFCKIIHQTVWRKSPATKKKKNKNWCENKDLKISFNFSSELRITSKYLV